MVSNNKVRYQAVDNGHEIVGSREYFNRSLYGGHEHDDLSERFITFAGDLPIAMGVITDWSKQISGAVGNYAKSGVLMSGLAVTSGEKFSSSSRWFHKAEDVHAVFRNGWMEYETQQLSPYTPKVKSNITVLPLQSENGFLVHYRIETDQRVLFCAGFGGITDFIGRFESADNKVRDFHAFNCEKNEVFCGINRAQVKSVNGASMWIGSSFSADFSTGSAAVMQTGAPAAFLDSEADDKISPVVKISASIEPGKVLDGFLVVIRNTEEAVLNKWLQCENPVELLKQQIRQKTAFVQLETPDSMFNQTFTPTVLGLDASWHGKTFYHGAVGDHSPFLGWRSWYGATVCGWHERVGKAIRSHLAEIQQPSDLPEKVWHDGADRPDLDHEGTQYHHLENSYGFIPCILGGNDIYNMQEVGIDMLLHHLEWTGDLKLADEVFDDIAGALDWEERILDPDGDGLYQNFLNTWISDGHSYNGGGCAQASSYNYRANLIMAKIAEKLGRPSRKFAECASKILDAVQDKLWLEDKGILAEFIDTIGNKLVHPSPELSTIYLAIDCGVVNEFQAESMLKFTETELENVTTTNGGRLVYSSNWLPKKYSTCGLFPAENNHLALSYFKLGLKDKGWEILQGIRDCFYNGRNPGMVTHILSGDGWSDGGDWDFSDVNSTYLRLLAEGLFGIRPNLLDGVIEIMPGFPDEWTHASLKLSDISLQYQRNGNEENFNVDYSSNTRVKFKIPLRLTEIKKVLLNEKNVEYELVTILNDSFVVIEIEAAEVLNLQVIHSGKAKIKEERQLKTKAVAPQKELSPGVEFEQLDISEYLNCSTDKLHSLEYRSPRPAGYSIGMRLNGRYAWEWNHCGHNAVEIDDPKLRNGIFKTPSGVEFSLPEYGNNLACASIWDNFPTVLDIPLKCKAEEIAIFFIGVTNAMQSQVENVKFTVQYQDGSAQVSSLIHPQDFDDWLVPALQTTNETVYFSDYNHGIVHRIATDSTKELAKILIEAIANEVIIGVLGINLRK